MKKTKMTVKVIMQHVNYLDGITEETEIARFINRNWAELFCNAYQETDPNVRLYIIEEIK